VKVMDPDVKGQCATGYLWLAGRPGGDGIFEFPPGGGQGCARGLGGAFGGYLQRDGYSAYGALSRGQRDLVPVGCWAHVRRKFVEAAQLESAQAVEVVAEIGKLYLIERRAREQ